MRISSTAGVLPLLAIAAAQSSTNETSQANATVCASGAHLIVARASLEVPGYGILRTVKDEILARLSDSNSIAVPYPATISGPITYFVSEPEGTGNLTKLVTEYGDACPTGKMVLMGYSQGAQVVGDTLIGSDYLAFAVFPNTTGIDQKYIDNVVAVVMMGDPANVAGQPFLVGNSTRNGTFPRNNTANWASTGLVDKMVSYCDAGDLYCDSGNSLAVHVGYIGEYGLQATDFVVKKIMSANSSNATTTSSAGSGSTSASATASHSSASPSSSSSGAASFVTGSSSYALIGMIQCISIFMITLAL